MQQYKPGTLQMFAVKRAFILITEDNRQINFELKKIDDALGLDRLSDTPELVQIMRWLVVYGVKVRLYCNRLKPLECLTGQWKNVVTHLGARNFHQLLYVAISCNERHYLYRKYTQPIAVPIGV